MRFLRPWSWLAALPAVWARDAVDTGEGAVKSIDVSVAAVFSS